MTDNRLAFPIKDYRSTPAEELTDSELVFSLMQQVAHVRNGLATGTVLDTPELRASMAKVERLIEENRHYL